MATIAGKKTVSDQRFVKATWLTLKGDTTDVGAAVDMGGVQDKTVQIIGAEGVGGSITIEGSMDGGTTWTALTDGQGNAITVTTPGVIEVIQENPELIRPNVTAGDAATDYDVFIGGTSIK